MLRVALHGRSLMQHRPAQGQLVVLIPGWKAPEAAMAPLRNYLRLLGHDARHWGLGRNTGTPVEDTLQLLEHVDELRQRTGRKVTLVGWSLGGVIARETARKAPDSVRRVITYGTPAFGGPTYTLGAPVWGEVACARYASMIEELDRDVPIAVPITAVFSRRDQVVSWAACIDRHSPNVRHIEVRSTHIALGVDPDVWRVVAWELGRREP